MARAKLKDVPGALKVVVIGMTGRPQSAAVVEGIVASRHNLVGVLYEQRFARRLKTLGFYKSLLRRHSLGFLAGRSFETVKFRLNALRKFGANKTKRSFLGPNLKVRDVNNENGLRFLRETAPDVIVLAGAPIVGPEVLKCAKLCTINVHRSLLPKYAGLDAIFWALYHNEQCTGATVHLVDEQIDNGKIITQKERIIKPTDNVETLTQWYYEVCPHLICEALDMLAGRSFDPLEQEQTQRSYFSWPSKAQRKELAVRLASRARGTLG